MTVFYVVEEYGRLVTPLITGISMCLSGYAYNLHSASVNYRINEVVEGMCEGNPVCCISSIRTELSKANIASW